MWGHSGRLVGILLRVTLGLAVVVGVLGLVCGWHSTVFTTAALLAVVVAVWVVRALAREWSWLARGSWWWGP